MKKERAGDQFFNKDAKTCKSGLEANSAPQIVWQELDFENPGQIIDLVRDRGGRKDISKLLMAVTLDSIPSDYHQQVLELMEEKGDSSNLHLLLPAICQQKFSAENSAKAWEIVEKFGDQEFIFHLEQFFITDLSGKDLERALDIIKSLKKERAQRVRAVELAKSISGYDYDVSNLLEDLNFIKEHGDREVIHHLRWALRSGRLSGEHEPLVYEIIELVNQR